MRDPAISRCSLAAALLVAVAGCATTESSCLIGEPDGGASVLAPRASSPFASASMGLPAAARAAGSEVRFSARAVFVPPPGGEADFVGGGAGGGMMLAYLAEPEGVQGAIWFEFGVERSEHQDSLGRSADHLTAMIGFRWADLWSARTEVYLAMGAAYHALAASGGEEMSGAGAYCGAGVELLVSSAVFASAELRAHAFWEDSSSGGSGFCAALAVGVGLRF